MENQLALFDYSQLDLDTRSELRVDEAKLDLHFNQAGMHLYEGGKILAKWRDKLSHNKTGGFEGWLNQRYPKLNLRQAYRFIDVATNFNLDNLSRLQFQSSALYLLAASSVPDEARQEALDRAEQGETISHKVAQEIAEKHKIIEQQKERIGQLEEQIKTVQRSVLSNEAKEKEITKLKDILKETKEESFRRLEKIGELSVELQKKPEPVEKEVPPPDYDRVKKELASLKQDVETKTKRIDSLNKKLIQTETELSLFDEKQREVKTVSLLTQAQKMIREAISINQSNAMTEAICRWSSNLIEDLKFFQPDSKVIDIHEVKYE
jgi:small-conductance mechanosensitive channel